jgi:Mn-containing catalase
LAKSELEAGKELSSVEKIVLGRECYNSSWVLAGYQELVQKSDTITDDEVINIQLPTAIDLFRMREIMQRQSLTLALLALKNVFAEELSTIREEEIKYRPTQEKRQEEESQKKEERQEGEARQEEEKWQEEEERQQEEERQEEEEERQKEEASLWERNLRVRMDWEYW